MHNNQLQDLDVSILDQVTGGKRPDGGGPTPAPTEPREPMGPSLGGGIAGLATREHPRNVDRRV